MIAVKNNKYLKFIKQPIPFAVAKICKQWHKNPNQPHPILLPISKSKPINEDTQIRSLKGIRLSLQVGGKVDNGFGGFRALVARVLSEFDNLEYVRGVIRIKKQTNHV